MEHGLDWQRFWRGDLGESSELFASTGLLLEQCISLRTDAAVAAILCRYIFPDVFPGITILAIEKNRPLISFWHAGGGARFKTEIKTDDKTTHLLLLIKVKCQKKQKAKTKHAPSLLLKETKATGSTEFL